MLGYADHHHALLQAVARELNSVHAQMAEGIGDANCEDRDNAARLTVARSQVAAALKAVRCAVAKEVDASWMEGDVGADAGDLETLQEAATLRSSALRARDVAEAKLTALRGDKEELLLRLKDLAEQEVIAAEDQEAYFMEESEREENLLSQCKELERDTQNLRNQVISKGRRLDARWSLNHAFAQQRRSADRTKAKAIEDAEGAKMILSLKKITETHLKMREEERAEVQIANEADKKKLKERAETLRIEFEQICEGHQGQASELEAHIADLERNFEEGWNEGDCQLRQILEEQNRRAQQAIEKLEQELQAQSHILQANVDCLEETGEGDHHDLIEVGRAAEERMEAQLDAKRRDIELNSEVERLRCEQLRRKHLHKAEILSEEARLFQQGIGFLRESYSGFQRTVKASPRPPPVPNYASPYTAHARKLVRAGAEQSTLG
ncbi:unnamed protein product [Polarella glacialis]|uniref:Uncharacterized protein n=2 Tax=Polarella glacialis TaxID=89957 RepID=A0A813K4G3_POLGL|nr:unnamed protein product [Polarella glacialis]